MGYDDFLNAYSRIIQNLLTITLEFCDNTFGVAPCTATGAVKCYKTLQNCQDPDNFITTTGKDYNICSDKKPLPFPGEIWRPLLLKRPQYRATEIDPARSLTKNARVSYDLLNPASNDIGIDPHVTERSTYPGNVGPYWDLFWARNIYYVGKDVIDRSGFHGDVIGGYKARRFIMDHVEFNIDGTCRLICKDFLKTADSVNIPAATDGKVADDPLVAGAAVINASTDTDMTQYPTAGWVHVGAEGENIIKYTGKAGQQFTGCTWQKFGTSQVNAALDTKIQLGYVKESTNVVDIMLDVLEDQIGYSAGEINSSEFTSERDLWLSGYTFTIGWFKPIKGSQRLRQLQEQSGSNIWADEELQKIRFKVFAPEPPGTSYIELTESSNIKSITADYNESARISRVIVYFDIINNTLKLNEPNNYKQAVGDVSITSESAQRYGMKAIKQIFADGVQSSSIADTIVQHYKRRFLNPPKKFKVTVERKDADIDTAQIVKLTHRRNINSDGTQKDGALFQVLKRESKTPGTMLLTVMDTRWTLRYGFIAHTGAANYDAATDLEKEHCYIGNANNLVGAAGELGFHVF